MVSVDSRPYVPGVGQMGSPSWPGGTGGSSPYSLPGNNPVAGGGSGGFGGGDEDEPDAGILPSNWNGQNFPYQPFLNATNKGAGIAQQALVFAAGFNPLEQWREIAQGTDPLGGKISNGQRLFMLGMMAAPELCNLHLGIPEGSMDPYRVPASDAVGGHHIMAKAAFKTHPNYNEDTALCISQALMRAKGWNHDLMTGRQAKAYDELAQAITNGEAIGSVGSMADHEAIAYDALRAGGATPGEADWLVRQAMLDLQRHGVNNPSNLPRFPRFVPRH